MCGVVCACKRACMYIAWPLVVSIFFVTSQYEGTEGTKQSIFLHLLECTLLNSHHLLQTQQDKENFSGLYNDIRHNLH
jgi:hypothetical protein